MNTPMYIRKIIEIKKKKQVYLLIVKKKKKNRIY